MIKRLVRLKREDGITQGYWVTTKKIKKEPWRYAKFELWKDGTLRRVVRDKRGWFVTWEIMDVSYPPPPPPLDDEEYYVYRVDFDIREKFES